MRALLFLALLSASPDPQLTPGVVDETVTRAVICSTRTADRRKVTTAMRKEVFRRYGIPWERRGEFETDHRVSLCAGGSNSLLNLWPQPWPSARRKDVLEVRACRKLCKGEITLKQAQEALLHWVDTADGMTPAPRPGG